MMSTSIARLLLVILWSCVIRYIAWPLAHLLAFTSDRVRDQLKGRLHADKIAVELATKRRGFDDCAVFFCSSAGEYEQAKPLIDRLASNSRMLCHVIFFSASGVEFLRARKEDISWTLAPPDDVFEWGTIFAALRPSITIIVRHELWPAFLWSASQWSKVILINAVVPALLGHRADLRQRLSLKMKGWLLWLVDMVCVVSQEDVDFFENRLGLPKSKVIVTGDTKYDRVLERAAEGEKRAGNLRAIFREAWHPGATDKVLIGGSVYTQDVELILAALDDERLASVRAIVVPHDVSSGNIAKIIDMISRRGYVVELLSEIRAAEFKFTEPHPRFIVVDEMGRLFDLYSVADIAWVGGAIHAKVHNVLEPAAWGLPVSCGNHIENSQEAETMRDEGLLLRANSGAEAAERWLSFFGDQKNYAIKTRRFAEKMTGASRQVLGSILPDAVQGGVK